MFRLFTKRIIIKKRGVGSMMFRQVLIDAFPVTKPVIQLCRFLFVYGKCILVDFERL